MAPVEDYSSAAMGGPTGGGGVEPRRRRGVPLVVQNDVIEAATALLNDGGWDALSMRAVCRHLGVSLPTVYAVAHSREAVVELAGARGLEAWAREWRSATRPAVVGAAAAMAARPWLFDLVRLQPPTARAALALLPEATARQVALLGSPAPQPAASAASVLDRALLVWMSLELAHRLSTVGLRSARNGEVSSNVLAAVLGTVG